MTAEETDIAASAAAGRPARHRRLPGLALWLAGVIGLCTGAWYVHTRYITLNLAEVVPGRVYRSARPDTESLRRWTEVFGLRSVISLRNEIDDPYDAAEADEARRLGIAYRNIRISASDLPPRPALIELVEAIDTMPRPVLIHCDAGADRTGVASVLAEMADTGDPLETARRQMSSARLHLISNPDHVEGVLDLFETHRRDHPQPYSSADTDWQAFRLFAAEHYRKRYYHVRIEAPDQVIARGGAEVPVEVTVTNGSHELLPASDPDRVFLVAATLDPPDDGASDSVVGAARLPARDLPPGASASVSVSITAPAEPGDHTIYVDLLERGEYWFSSQGLPSARVTLRVTTGPTDAEPN